MNLPILKAVIYYTNPKYDMVKIIFAVPDGRWPYDSCLSLDHKLERGTGFEYLTKQIKIPASKIEVIK